MPQDITDVVSYFAFSSMNGSADEFPMTLFFVTLKAGDDGEH